MRSPLPILLAATILAGCATSSPHPHLEVPTAPTAADSFEARATYYKRYALQSRETGHLFLHGGDRVYWPEDLRPAIDDESPTAKAIADHIEARVRVEQWDWLSQSSSYAAAGGLLVGLGALGVGLTTTIVSDDKQIEDLGTTAMLGGLAVGGGLLGAGLVGVFTYVFIVDEDERRAGEAADRAARTYPQALTDRLGVGVDANGLLFDLRTKVPESEPAPMGAGDTTEL